MKMKNYDFLKAEEGLRLTSYKDVGGIWTIGYGHTGPEVRSGMIINEVQATHYLMKDVEWAENAVNSMKFPNITQNQFDALVSLTYNIGAKAFKNSTVAKRLSEGDVANAAEAISWWNKVNGKVIKGLVSRRERERKLFLTPDDPILPFPNNEIRDTKIKVLLDKLYKDLMEII